MDPRWPRSNCPLWRVPTARRVPCSRMSALRLLLTVTWAAWIWLELVAVLLPTVLDRLRGRGWPRDAGSILVLLACIATGFVAATRLARLDAGALPGPPQVLLAAGLLLIWAGLALRAWSIQHL